VWIECGEGRLGLGWSEGGPPAGGFRKVEARPLVALFVSSQLSPLHDPAMDFVLPQIIDNESWGPSGSHLPGAFKE
jgi:hypothetical protein